MEKITSKNNQLIKDTKKLFTSSKHRRENFQFVLEGARLCFDVLNSLYQVESFFITENAYEKYTEKADAVIKKANSSYLISDDVANSLGDTVTTQGVFAICKMQDDNLCVDKNKYIALDNVQDPSNFGAIVRTAEALGIDGIITSKCCDRYNPKSIRASMGSILRMNIINIDCLEDFLSDLKQQKFNIYSTVPDSAAQAITSIDFSKKTICVIGNEANGVSENVKNISNSLVTIPMLGRAESLNASVAASITMWEMLR